MWSRELPCVMLPPTRAHQVIDFARSRLGRGVAPAAVAAELTAEALRLGSLDNVSVIVVLVRTRGGCTHMGAVISHTMRVDWWHWQRRR